MPPELSKSEETANWILKSSQDLESAEILFKANKPTQWHQVLFFCQQSVEKSMKAFLTWNVTKFRWTHDLVEIGNQCVSLDASLQSEVSSVSYLSDYAWEFRYPGEDPEPTKDEAKKGIALAKKFQSVILSKLPKTVRPST